MTAVAVLLFLVITASSASNFTYFKSYDVQCETKTLGEPRTATGLNFNISIEVNRLVSEISLNNSNFTDISKKILSTHPEIAGIILASAIKAPILSLNVDGKLIHFLNRTKETEVFWKAFDVEHNGWALPFRDCNYLKRVWFYAYLFKNSEVGLQLFIKVKLNQCDFHLADIFGGTHRCDQETTEVSVSMIIKFMVYN